jgi:hypothetical protein
MKTIKLTEGDCIFVHSVLRIYAQQTPGLDSEDKDEIRKLATKWWVQQNYKKCEVDEMTLSEIYELLEQD